MEGSIPSPVTREDDMRRVVFREGRFFDAAFSVGEGAKEATPKEGDSWVTDPRASPWNAFWDIRKATLVELERLGLKPNPYFGHHRRRPLVSKDFH